MRTHRFFSLIGGPRFRAILVSVCALGLLLRGRGWSVAMLITATAGMGALNSCIKVLVRRRRPDGLPGLQQAGGYSFPSGHSSGSVTLLGALAYLAWCTTRHRMLLLGVVGASGAVAAAVGQSRVGLRAHHRSDVAAGFAAGVVWLALVLRLFARPLEREYRRGL